MLGKLHIRLTRGLLLVVYFLATTTAVSLHDHSASCDHDHTTGRTADCAGCDGDHIAGAGHCHDDADVGSSSPLPCPNPLADDDCAACRFLGLCSLAVAPPAMPESQDLLVAANPAEPIHQSRPLDRTLHSRAPPRLV
jgi:hypothetical protein